MSKIKSNIEELRKILNEVTFKDESAKEEAIEFLDAVDEEVDEMTDEIDSLNDEVKNGEDKIEELTEENKEIDYSEQIECGIGTIEYNVDNLQLCQLMESLGTVIEKKGSLQTLQLLEASN
jgi:predicted RNase H-like nuclease (RuvC/YqgF family)